MDALVLGLLGMFVLLGAATQRLTGMGFALVASPLVVLVLGAITGVQLLQVLSMTASLLVLAQVWREVEWGKAGLLLLPALAGILPGAWLAKTLPAPVLEIVIGGMIIVALLATIFSDRAKVFKGAPGLVGAGFLSGFMNVTASVGGPAVVLYALSTRWRHELFVATVQAYFVGLNIFSLAVKGLPLLPWQAWIVSAVALALGMVLGNHLARRVHADTARRGMIAVALLGAVATVVKGVLELA